MNAAVPPSGNPLELSGEVSERDFAAAQWTHIKPRMWIAALGVGVIGLALFVLWMSFVARPIGGIARWGVLGFLIYLALSYGVLWPRQWRRLFVQSKGLHGNLEYKVTDAGLEAKTALGQGLSPWDHFHAWKEGKSVFLLYLSDNLFQIVPKHFFASAADVDEFKALLSSKVRRK